MERTGLVTLHGNPLTLIGRALKAGDNAPDFSCLDAELKDVKLADFGAKIKIISVTPSLDTPVCDLQARRFNQEASGLPEDAVVINISMDLPFAISRFCTAAGITRVTTLSDHRDASFGIAYGVLIKELRLLCRSIFVIDRKNVVRYLEIVRETADQPDYDRALAEARKLLG